MNKYELAGHKLLWEWGVTIRKFRSSSSGVAYLYTNEIECPRPRGLMSFAILSHEIGHVVCGHTIHPHAQKRWEEEYEAWQFALDRCREAGFPVKQKLRWQIKRDMNYALGKALRRGLVGMPAKSKRYPK